MPLKDASRETRLILEHVVTDTDYKAAQDGDGGPLAEISIIAS